MALVKMLGTTNKKFEDRCGWTATGMFVYTVFIFGDMHTSYIKECKINENVMTLITRNSEYTFELLDDHNFKSFKLNDAEVLEREENCE